MGDVLPGLVHPVLEVVLLVDGLGGDGPDLARVAGLLEQTGHHAPVGHLALDDAGCGPGAAVGGVGDAELPALLHACDVFALPSITAAEAFGVVQVEAMACGRPVVGCVLPSGVGFVNQDGVTGFQVPPADAAALGAGLRRLFEDAPLRGHWLRLEESWRAAREHQFHPAAVTALLGEALAAVTLMPEWRGADAVDRYLDEMDRIAPGTLLLIPDAEEAVRG